MRPKRGVGDGAEERGGGGEGRIEVASVYHLRRNRRRRRPMGFAQARPACPRTG